MDEWQATYSYDVTDRVKFLSCSSNYIKSAILKFDITSIKNLNRQLIDSKTRQMLEDCNINLNCINLEKYPCCLCINFCNDEVMFMSTGKFPDSYINSIKEMVKKCGHKNLVVKVRKIKVIR